MGAKDNVKSGEWTLILCNLNATNSLAGGKLQLRDEKRFERPQLASSQAIGVIGFPFEFPFEAIGKRFFSLLPICSCEVWAVKLQWTEVATRTAGQNSNGEKADKASCFAQLYVTKVFSGTSPWSVFRVQSVLNQLSFCNKGGIADMQGLSATRAAAYIAELRRLLRWSCSGPECDCGFGNCRRR
jgi:hypothetical protein